MAMEQNSLIGMPSRANTPPNPTPAFNSISSAGQVSGNSTPEPQKPQTSPVEQLLTRFSPIVQQFSDLAGMPDYALATEELTLVKKAMNNWLDKVANNLPQTMNSGNGGESPQTNSAATAAY